MGVHYGYRPQGNTPYVPPSFPRDPFFNAVSLLLHGDGTNGAQNNTFLDSSTNNFTVTRNGNTTQGTNTPFSQAAGYWSNYFDGTGDFLSSSIFNVSASDWTAEFWVYFSSISGSKTMLHFNNGGNGGCNIWSNGGSLTVDNGTAAPTNNTISYNFIPNVWTHVAITYTLSTATIKAFINGNSVGTNTPSLLTTNQIDIAQFEPLNNIFFGYMSNIRITNNLVYTSNFTPSTTPLTAISGTQLLTCQSNRFVDNSSNNFTITRNGDTSVQPFSPFAPTAAYSTSVNGGSMYFDGTGDNLTFPSGAAFQFGTGDFTVESWVYLTAAPAYQYIIDARNSGQSTNWAFGFGVGVPGRVGFYNGSTTIGEASISVTVNSWAHCVAVRSGTTLSVFVNGIRVATATDSTNFNISPTISYIGSRYSSNDYMTGYLSNVRTVKGTAVYDPTLTTLTVPTAPLTAISGTQLLLSGTNAGIFDNAIENNLETVGNAQVSTAVTKFGTGSMKFTATGDYCVAASNLSMLFNTGNFTVECWVYPTALGTYSMIAAPIGFNGYFALNSSGYLQTYDNSGGSGTNQTSGAAVTINTWTHIAWVKNNNVLTGYVNGVSVFSASFTTSWTGITGFWIGQSPSYAGSYNMIGYIDDLRITKGIARYTANFTPPILPLSLL